MTKRKTIVTDGDPRAVVESVKNGDLPGRTILISDLVKIHDAIAKKLFDKPGFDWTKYSPDAILKAIAELK